MRHFVKLRPYLKEFFAQIQSTYQLSIYTAGTRAYAEQVAVMICRYLIGAILDEEGLNELRSKVKQNDDEFRRCMANVARLKQLQLTKASSTDVVTSKASSKNKSVSFGVGSDGGDTDEQGAAEVSYANSMASGKGQANEMNNCQLADREKQLLRLSEERDRLRQELKDSEELELQATELRRKLFGSRIVSRTDVGDLGKDVKSLKRVFPCGGLMVRRLGFACYYLSITIC
jgi:RNA polymerase II subunit A-like phosphatase